MPSASAVPRSIATWPSQELALAGSSDAEGGLWTRLVIAPLLLDQPIVLGRRVVGVQLVIADAHLGLRQAVSAVMAGAAIQRCRAHFLRNVLAQVPKGSAEMVAAAIGTIFAQPTRPMCMSS
jgi:hypothetical protein